MRSSHKVQSEIGQANKVKKHISNIENDSLFKDIEKSNDYNDPLNLNNMEESLNTDQS